MSRKFYIVDGIFTVKEVPYVNRKVDSGKQQDDLVSLAKMLQKMLKGEQETFTSKDLNMSIDFDKLIEELGTNDQVDYSKFRNILRTELEKHRNEADFDRFDWQN